jgi:hypothetical protein
VRTNRKTGEERHFIWYSKGNQCWYVNYWDDPIHADFPTLPEAMNWLHDELVRIQPIEVP